MVWTEDLFDDDVFTFALVDESLEGTVEGFVAVLRAEVGVADYGL